METLRVQSMSHAYGVDADSLSVFELENEDRQGLVELGESLRRGIWPRSFAIWMAVFYVAMFIIRPWEQLFPWLTLIHFERCFAIAMICVVVSTRGFRLSLDFQSIAIYLFTASLGVSYVFAQQPDLCWRFFYSYLTLVIFYLVIASVIRTPYELIFMVSSYIFTMMVYLAKSQWEYFLHDQHRHDMGVDRLVGIENTFGGPNSLAMSIVVSLPMLLMLYLVRQQFCHNWSEIYRKWYSRGLLLYLVLALTSLALTNSRSGMVSFLVFIGILGLRGQTVTRKVGYLFTGMAFLGCVWFVLPEDTQGRYRTIWDPESGPAAAQVSAEGREVGFWAGMEMFHQFPLTGVGIGNFVDYRTKYVDGVPLQAHNLPGQLLGETGTLGALGFLLLITGILLNCRRIKSAARGSDVAMQKVLFEFAIAAQTSVVLLLFTGLFGHNVYRFNWLWLAAFCLLAAEFHRRAQVARTTTE